MRAITVRQPWATLLALGEKRYETRSWKTILRGPIAIHAGQQVDKEALQNEYVEEALDRHGYLTIADLPRGSIVAIANLTNCLQVTEVLQSGCMLENGHQVSDPEWTFGDFTVGRYAWQMDIIQRLETPIAAKGKLGIWEWEEKV